MTELGTRFGVDNIVADEGDKRKLFSLIFLIFLYVFKIFIYYYINHGSHVPIMSAY